MVRLGSGAPWIEARLSQALTPGARLQSAETGYALISLWDDGLLRVESSASVELARMHASANRRVVRIAVHQTAGSASYASPPPINGASRRLRVELPGATVDLEGTATISVLTDGSLHLHVHQGAAHVKLPEALVELAAGQELVVQETGAYMVL
jgi:ferric-dicitrate binding protein FerR (iron transport regulator)